jgi:hypothetical protein
LSLAIEQHTILSEDLCEDSDSKRTRLENLENGEFELIEIFELERAELFAESRRFVGDQATFLLQSLELRWGVDGPQIVCSETDVKLLGFLAVVRAVQEDLVRTHWLQSCCSLCLRGTRTGMGRLL